MMEHAADKTAHGGLTRQLRTGLVGWRRRGRLADGVVDENETRKARVTVDMDVSQGIEHAKRPGYDEWRFASGNCEQFGNILPAADVVVAGGRNGAVTLAARVECDDAIGAGEVVYLALEY